MTDEVDKARAWDALQETHKQFADTLAAKDALIREMVRALDSLTDVVSEHFAELLEDDNACDGIDVPALCGADVCNDSGCLAWRINEACAALVRAKQEMGE